MNKLFLIIGIVLILISSFFWYKYSLDKAIEIKHPEWKNYTLDNESARRFVDVVYDSQNNPHIFYYAELTKEGIKHVYSNNTLEDYYKNDRRWNSELLKGGKDTGFFISAAALKDTLYISFQDYAIADEKLLLAINDSITILDSKEKSGLNAGMYSSVCLANGKPYVLYHVEEGRKLMLADPQQNLHLLETGTGWNIDCISDNKSIFVGYRGRDDMNLRLGTFNIESEEWSSKRFQVNASSIALFFWNNSPYVVYYDHDDKGIYLSEFYEFNPRRIADGSETLLRAATSNNQAYILYSHYWSGLYLLNSSNLIDFDKTVVASGPDIGLFNALAVTPNDDIKIAYVEDNSLKFKEYERSSYLYMMNKKMESIKKDKMLGSITALVGILFIIFGVKQWKKEKS